MEPPPIDISPFNWEIVWAILQRHIPEYEVWAFGSRAKWTAREYSDLDLAVIGDQPLALAVKAALAEDLEESDLPFKVDVVDWATTKERFRRIIRKNCVVVQEGARGTAGMGPGTVASGWTPARLGELVEIKHGWPFKSAYFDRDLTGRPIVVSIGNFRYTGGFRFEETAVKEYRGGYPKEYELAPHDILLVMTCQTAGGEILGIPARVPNDGRVYLHNQRLGKVVIRDGTRVDSNYLYWLFQWQDFNRELVTSASGTKILHTAPSRIEAFCFELPTLPEQRAIAHILGTLDDKIELNRRMKETLEAMARALFKSWFVDFDPVRAKMEGRWRPGQSLPGLPAHLYDLFPNHLVDSELREIPEGWEVRSLGNLIELAYGKALKADSRRDGTVPVYGSNGQIGWHNEKFVSGPGIVVGRKGNPGIVTWVPTDFFPIDTTFYVVPKGENQHLHFLFYALRAQNLASIAADSAVPGLNRKIAYMNEQVVPSNPIIDQFDEYAGAIFGRGYHRKVESRTLVALRDTLLPKLISGQLRVKDAEGIVGRAV